MSMKTYDYDGLRETGDTIRLLTLAPARDRTAPLSCTIREAEISEQNFEALSYCWGRPMPGPDLECDGKAVSINQSLDTALRYMRYKDKVRTLWVDAVCINQKDVLEKQSQIPLMSRIYSEAKHCLVWIGEADDDTATLFKLIIAAYVAYRAGRRVSAVRRVKGHDGFELEGLVGSWGAAIKKFSSRPWFQRLWTFQEVMLNSSPLLICGDHVLPWRRVQGIQHWLGWGLRDLDVWRVGDKNLLQPGQLDGWDARYHLTGLMINIKNLQAFEPRDKVFGTLAICDGVGLGTPIVDYSRNVPDVYTAATIAWLERLDSLTCITLACTARKTPGLPSWVIDWNSQTYQDAVVRERGGFFFDKVSLLGRSATRDSKLRFGINGKSLEVHGIVVDHVRRHIGSPLLQTAEYLEPAKIEGPRFQVTKREPSKIYAERRTLLTWLQFIEHGNTELLITRLSALLVHRHANKVAFPASVNLRESWELKGLWSDYNERAMNKYLQNLLELSRQITPESIHDQAEFNDACDKINLHTINHQGDMSLDLLMKLRHETLFETASGEVGLAPFHRLQDGDAIALAAGSDYPLVLRPTGSIGVHEFVCPATISGMMNGEFWPIDDKVESLPTLVLI